MLCVGEKYKKDWEVGERSTKYNTDGSIARSDYTPKMDPFENKNTDFDDFQDDPVFMEPEKEVKPL